MSSSSYGRGQLQFNCEHWELSNRYPKLQRNQTLLFGDKSVNWMQYVQHEGGASGPTGFQRKNRALPVAFSHDCKDLRIGSQLYTRTDDGTYVAMPAFWNKQDQLPYIEEFARRGHFVAVANRRSRIPESQLTYPSSEEPHANESDTTKTEEAVSPSTASRQLATALDEALKSIRNLSKAVAPPDPSELEEAFKTFLSAPSGTEGEDITSAALKGLIKSLLDNSPGTTDDDDSGKPSLEKTLKSLIPEAVRNSSGSSTEDESSDEASIVTEAESSEASTETDDDAYESWSDCSSRESEEVESEDETGRVFPNTVDFSGSERSEVPEDEDAEGSSDETYEFEDSDAQESPVDREAFGAGQMGAYGGGDLGNETDLESDDDEQPEPSFLKFFRSRVSEEVESEGETRIRRNTLDISDSEGSEVLEDEDAEDSSGETNEAEDSDADLESDNEEQPELSLNFLRSRRKRNKRSQPRKVSLTIFNTRSPVPERVFRFTRELPYLLYDSPPAIHPFETLAVWPLGGGNVLFADFEVNTYFIRELRPSKLHSESIFWPFALL